MADVQVTKDLPNKTLTSQYGVNAPREKAWRAYSDKEWFEKWWGPEGWETTVKKFEFKEKGRIHYAMKCVDENQKEWFGKESWGLMDIQTIDDRRSFMYWDAFSDESGEPKTDMPRLTITNEFVDEDGKTRIISRCLADNEGQLEELLNMGMVEGFSSQLNKLDRLLAEEA